MEGLVGIKYIAFVYLLQPFCKSTMDIISVQGERRSQNTCLTMVHKPPPPPPLRGQPLSATWDVLGCSISKALEAITTMYKGLC